MKSSVASCSASMPSTVQRNGSGATLLVISLAWRQQVGPQGGSNGLSRAGWRCTQADGVLGNALRLGSTWSAKCSPLPSRLQPHQPRKGQLADQQAGAALVLADLAQRHRARPEAVRLLCGTGNGR